MHHSMRLDAQTWKIRMGTDNAKRSVHIFADRNNNAARIKQRKIITVPRRNPFLRRQMRPEQCVARPTCHMIRRCRRINKVNQFLGTFRLFVGHEKALRSINRKRPAHRLVFTKQKMVGMTGFEPAASSSRTMRATKLRHIPTTICILASFVGKCKHYFFSLSARQIASLIVARSR